RGGGLALVGPRAGHGHAHVPVLRGLEGRAPGAVGGPAAGPAVGAGHHQRPQGRLLQSPAAGIGPSHGLGGGPEPLEGTVRGRPSGSGSPPALPLGSVPPPRRLTPQRATTHAKELSPGPAGPPRPPHRRHNKASIPEQGSDN